MISKPVNYMGYDVVGIEDKDLGRFSYDGKHGYIDWVSPDHLDDMSVKVETLKLFLKKAPEILTILGVDVND